MKTIKIKAWGKEHDLFFSLNRYTFNNNLCVNLMEVDKGQWSTLTTNLGILLADDEAFIDLNNNTGFDKIFIENGIAKPTGYEVPSGFCRYPCFKFDMDVVREYMVE